MIPYDYPAYPNLERTVVALGSLADELLFVGGATIGLYVTELQVREPRATEDVDTVCEATTYIELSRFADRMRSIGFNEDMSSNVICRWTKGDLVVDLMPVDESALDGTGRNGAGSLVRARERGYSLRNRGRVANWANMPWSCTRR